MKKNVVLFGGQLFNKGAQAMTFITVDEIAKRMPDHSVILLSSKDYKRNELEKAQYKFTILPFPRYRILLLAAVSKRIRFLEKLAIDEADRNVIDALHNADYVLDISGYSLGSDWGCDLSMGYCMRLNYAKKCGAKVYLMPQSFGPFNYTGKQANATLKQIKNSLPRADLIMAREEDGYRLLNNQFNLHNVIKTYDMVLQNKGINLANIYTIVPVFFNPIIESDSVAIIPNSKTFKFGGSNEQIQLYDTIVETLKESQKNIYFMIHSSEDWDICQKLYERYKHDYDKCYLIEKELNSVEFDQLVSKFDFIIASRYHAIVHAYRNSVPAIVLGWAIKYKELMGLFDQNKYQFNVRENVDLQHIRIAINRLSAEYKKESTKIKENLVLIQKDNVFDRIV